VQLDNEELPHFKDREPQTQQAKQDCNNSGDETSSSHPLNFDASQLENKHSSFARRFWEWTGLGKTTLLEILRFLMIFVPLVAFVADQRERELARQESYRKEIQLAQKEIFSNYLEEMKEFLLNRQLSQEPVQRVVRAETFSVLRQLDGEQRGELLRFLFETDLIGTRCRLTSSGADACEAPLLELNGARLDEVTFDTPLSLRRISLVGASLVDARLSGSDLTGANMREADLQNANLTNAILSDAKLMKADLQDTTLVCASLVRSALTNANLTGANLQKADLREADLSQVAWKGANFKGAIYNKATVFPNGFDKNKEGVKLFNPDEPEGQECGQVQTQSPSPLQLLLSSPIAPQF